MKRPRAYTRSFPRKRETGPGPRIRGDERKHG